MSKKKAKNKAKPEKRYIIVIDDEVNGFENGVHHGEPMSKDDIITALEEIAECETDMETVHVYEVKEVEFKVQVQTEPTATARFL